MVRLLLSLALACSVAACGSEAEPGAGRPTRPPDVILFVADDQGLFLGACGAHVAGDSSGWLTTPHLDRLAREGLRIDGAYAASAVCTPSRATLYTGLFPSRNGCDGFTPIGVGVPIWTDRLGPAGYRTGLIGKLGGKPVERFRFDFFARALPADPGARSIDWYVQQLEAFLDEDDGRPFCVVVNLRDAHYPFPTDGAPTGASEERAHDPADVVVPGFLPDLPAVRGELARYADSVRRLDATVGRMLRAAEARVPAERLLVVHTTDHGAPFPFAKTTLYEAGIRVPLLCRWTGTIRAGRSSSALVSLADILPTLLELAGTAPPPDLDGRSLVGLLRGETDEHREAIFATHTSHRVEPLVPSRSVRVGRWKYIRNLRPEARFENAVMLTSASWASIVEASSTDPALAARVASLQLRPREELYDLESDPYELENLAEMPRHADVRGRLAVRLRDFMEAQSDPFVAEW